MVKVFHGKGVFRKIPNHDREGAIWSCHQVSKNHSRIGGKLPLGAAVLGHAGAQLEANGHHYLSTDSVMEKLWPELDAHLAPPVQITGVTGPICLAITMEMPNLSEWQHARLFLFLSLILQELSRRIGVVMSPVEFVHEVPGGLTAIGTHENEGTEANGWSGTNNVHVNDTGQQPPRAAGQRRWRRR